MTKQFATPRVKIQHPWKQPGSNLSPHTFPRPEGSATACPQHESACSGRGMDGRMPRETLADRVSFPAGFWGMLRAPNWMMLFLVSLFVLLLGNLN